MRALWGWRKKRNKFWFLNHVVDSHILQIWYFSGGFPFAFCIAPSKTWRQVHHPPSHAKHCRGEFLLLVVMIMMRMCWLLDAIMHITLFFVWVLMERCNMILIYQANILLSTHTRAILLDWQSSHKICLTNLGGTFVFHNLVTTSLNKKPLLDLFYSRLFKFYSCGRVKLMCRIVRWKFRTRRGVKKGRGMEFVALGCISKAAQEFRTKWG